jgi:hypothetical protein
MRKYTKAAEMAARSRLEGAVKHLDAHIEVLLNASETDAVDGYLYELSLAAIDAARGRRTRASVDEYSKSVAAALSTSHHVTDAVVDRQIAWTKLMIATGAEGESVIGWRR